ncbi:MAG: zinc ribbon domain-containing protein [Anaerolineae bacterium]
MDLCGRRPLPVTGSGGHRIGEEGRTTVRPLFIKKRVAFKRGKRVIFLDRWTPTTQTCSTCGERQELDLKQRTFACGHCGLVLDRDHNAAINIRCAGASVHTARGDVSPDSSGIAVDGRSPRL